jgi:hypothetical protein
MSVPPHRRPLPFTWRHFVCEIARDAMYFFWGASFLAAPGIKRYAFYGLIAFAIRFATWKEEYR